jgi:hypothetical protein
MRYDYAWILYLFGVRHKVIEASLRVFCAASRIDYTALCALCQKSVEQAYAEYSHLVLEEIQRSGHDFDVRLTGTLIPELRPAILQKFRLLSPPESHMAQLWKDFSFFDALSVS